MKIRTASRVMVGLTAVVSVAIGAARFAMAARVREARDTQAAVLRFRQGCFELNSLTADYLLRQTPRAAMQWQQRWRSLRDVLDGIASARGGAGEQVDGLARALGDAGGLFCELQSRRQDVAATDPESPAAPVGPELWHRRARTLLMTLHAMIDGSTRLLYASQDAERRLHRLDFLTTLGSLLLLLGLLLGTSLWLTRAVLAPLGRLDAGVRIVGKGNLDHVVDVPSRNELGELATSFNTMARDLKRTLASRDELDRSNRDLEHFAYVASHDLQEPLRKIIAFGERLEALAGSSLDEKGRDYLARMVGAAGRMRDLIDGLLSYARVSTRANVPSPVDLAAALADVVGDLDGQLQATAGRVVAEHLPVVHADPLHIRQLMQNLVSNALKYRRPGVAPVVRVWSERGGDETGRAVVRIHVADNGIGFDEKHAARLFVLFQRLHSRAEYEGTGIGLAVCRRIAELYGGSIGVRSRPGEGSVFTVTLPAEPEGPAAGAAHARLHDGAAAAGETGVPPPDGGAPDVARQA